MANLNLGPGNAVWQSVAAKNVVSYIEDQLLVVHRRLGNKFQFGCEWGQ